MEQQKKEEEVIELGTFLDDYVKHSTFYVNSLSFPEMESLSALCDTFLPSNDVVSSSAAADDSIAKFFLSSASMAGTPQRIGGLISQRLKHPKKWLIRVVLWMLSTRVGTFILCGLLSISTHFPFFLKFSQIHLHKREKILHSWSLSFFSLLRMLFKTVKLLCLLVFFSQVDEKGENLAWKAMDYPGPDPEFKKEQEAALKLAKNNEEEKEKLFGPLYKGLIDMNLPRDITANSLRLSGFPVFTYRPKINNPSWPSLVIKCDAVVVGSGSGGGVVAGVLAKAGYKVVVIEKGNYFARSNLSLLEGPSMDQMYLSAGLMATDDMGVVVLAGSTVGGGSTINWSASIRTPQHVTDEWSNAYGLEIFDSKLYKEALDVVCEKMGVQSEINEEGFNNAILRKGCEELGYNVNTIPRNSSSDHYCGWCCLGCKDGKKKGTCETWLLDLVNSGNGLILPNCEAIKVLHKRRRRGNRRVASGVAFAFGKEVCVVQSKVTIVACGALSTPPLLKRSGLKNPNIGKHLHLHPVTMAWGYFPDDQPLAWPEKHKKSYQGGIMTAMSLVTSDKLYGAVIQTPSLHPGMFASLMPWVSGVDMKMKMGRFSRTAHIFALARDKGSGKVNSPNSISYQMEAADEENLQKGLEKGLRILAAAGAEEIGTHHSKGRSLNVKKESYKEFDKFVKRESSRSLRDLSTQICSAHQMGSCRMGIDPRNSVVNEMGETWEVEGLFIADTSVFPTALGVNPMVTVQAIAYCTAQSVLQLLKRKKFC
ncbi:long-chain-alcohol oxidase FAO4A isoform X3 [Jatropha curcas]|uniref:long-chain-alcohol oxidase FAO4A isoform X3 n=1 Tax=Jatropha curcas TaxID=180498 RepID=UPI00189335F6|nr:long-chain-alcohol oxidase FAO4A isoform X3 [Jatropha curcas]